MIERLARNQNWAKAAPVMGILAGAALFLTFKPTETMFWALINIPLYLFHQTEEHLWPGGFKNYVNTSINKDPEGVETLTDTKVFWINIVLVWILFTIFGALAFVNVNFGLVIIVFSIINCATHIVEGFKSKHWNPGLVIASIQFLVSLYAAWFITTHGLTYPIVWWVGTIMFAVVVHVFLFKVVMSK
jgi:hypothetical protein